MEKLYLGSSVVMRERPVLDDDKGFPPRNGTARLWLGEEDSALGGGINFASSSSGDSIVESEPVSLSKLVTTTFPFFMIRWELLGKEDVKNEVSSLF